MRGFRVDHADPPALKRRLYDEHRIEVPVFETPARLGAARLGAGLQRREPTCSALDAALASSR